MDLNQAACSFGEISPSSQNGLQVHLCLGTPTLFMQSAISTGTRLMWPFVQVAALSDTNPNYKCGMLVVKRNICAASTSTAVFLQVLPDPLQQHQFHGA
jgi:hypothetical protein